MPPRGASIMKTYICLNCLNVIDEDNWPRHGDFMCNFTKPLYKHHGQRVSYSEFRRLLSMREHVAIERVPRKLQDDAIRALDIIEHVRQRDDIVMCEQGNEGRRASRDYLLQAVLDDIDVARDALYMHEAVHNTWAALGAYLQSRDEFYHDIDEYKFSLQFDEARR